jgi:hypothetical protein
MRQKFSAVIENVLLCITTVDLKWSLWGSRKNQAKLPQNFELEKIQMSLNYVSHEVAEPCGMNLWDFSLENASRFSFSSRLHSGSSLECLRPHFRNRATITKVKLFRQS